MNYPIYLDYNATTPCAPEVIEAMLPYFGTHFGNAASKSHPYGWMAENAVEEAREKIAHLIGAKAKEIIFTSGATEAINLGIKGTFEAYQGEKQHYITALTEHKAVLDTFAEIEKRGAEVTYLPVDSMGNISMEELENSILPHTKLICLMWANNETGVIQPIEGIAVICQEKEVLFMSDATQAIGKIAVHPIDKGVHILCMSAHKMYGPKGVGAIYFSEKNPRVALRSQIDGGGHERGFRSGTLNVPGIVGLGKAAELAASNMNTERHRHKEWQNTFEKHLRATFPEIQIAGAQVSRLPHVSNLQIPGIPSATWFSKLSDRLAFSTGSACSSALAEPSHVLEAMGYTKTEAEEAVRLSWGRFTKEEEMMNLFESISEGLLSQ